MARSIHISTARTMLNSLAKPKRFACKTMTGALSILEFGYRPLAAFVAQRRKKSDGSKHYSKCQDLFIYLLLATY